MDQLRRRIVVIAKSCPKGLRDEERASHLLIHCSFTYKRWAAVISKYGMSWVIPRTNEDLFAQWNYRGNPSCAKIL